MKWKEIKPKIQKLQKQMKIVKTKEEKAQLRNKIFELHNSCEDSYDLNVRWLY